MRDLETENFVGAKTAPCLPAHRSHSIRCLSSVLQLSSVLCLRSGCWHCRRSLDHSCACLASHWCLVGLRLEQVKNRRYGRPLGCTYPNLFQVFFFWLNLSLKSDSVIIRRWDSQQVWFWEFGNEYWPTLKSNLSNRQTDLNCPNMLSRWTDQVRDKFSTW